MQPTIRSALALLAGVVAAVVVVTLTDTVVASIVSLPAGTDLSHAEGMRQAVAAMAPAALLSLVVGWSLAAAAGSYIAARLARTSPATHGMIVGLFVLIAIVIHLATIPHPLWLWAAAIILAPLAALLATRLATRSRVVVTPPTSSV